MSEKKWTLSRRDFFKTAGAAGLSSVLATVSGLPSATAAAAATEMAAGVVPK